MADRPSHRFVLIIEDDDNIASALEFVIAREGLAQDRVANGADAVGRIRDLRPDLILLDVMLPEVSGYDICRSVRMDKSLGNTKILMMTARGSSTERRRGMALGADGFISKPFELKELRDEMRRLLGAGP